MIFGFSVIIPAYNETETLRRCIRSIYEITLFSQTEIIVVGNKRSLDAVRHYSRLKLIETEENMEDSMNRGIRESKNDNIVKLDADISINPVDVFYLVDFLGKYDLVSCPAVTDAKSVLMRFLFAGRNILQKYALDLSSNGNTLIFRRSDLEAFGGFHYDTKLHFLYLNAGKRVYVDPSPFAKEYRSDYSVGFVKRRQIESGIKRYCLGVGFVRSTFHSIVRGRPFVLAGYLMARFGGRRIDAF